MGSVPDVILGPDYDGQTVRLSDLKSALAGEDGTFTLFASTRWISGSGVWTLSDIRPGASCEVRAVRRGVVTIGDRISSRLLLAEIPLGNLFDQPGNSTCVAPDYIAAGLGKPTWKPTIKQLDRDDPLWINFRALKPSTTSRTHGAARSRSGFAEDPGRSPSWTGLRRSAVPGLGPGDATRPGGRATLRSVRCDDAPSRAAPHRSGPAASSDRDHGPRPRRPR